MSVSVQDLKPRTSAATLSPRPLPPLVAGWPLVGVLPALLRDPFGFLVRTWQDQGDIFTLNLGFTKLTVLNHPRHAQHILRDQVQKYDKGGPLWDATRSLLGNGLVVSSGDFWLRQRRLMQPQFHRQRLASLTLLMVEAIDEALAAWETSAASGQPFNLLTGFNRLTMRVVIKTLFGSTLAPEVMDEVAQLLTFALDYLLVEGSTNTLPAWLPIPGRRRYQKTLARFDEIVYGVIRTSRQGNGPDDHLLGLLLNTIDEATGERMDDRQLRDEVATLFLAGYETTSLTLSWALHLLTQHPAAMQKLRAEVDHVLAGRQPNVTDLPNLPYNRMVIQEAMRLRPPSFWLPRTAVADDEIDGYRIPAGHMVVTLTYTQHRHPEFWPDAERFDPERFTAENSAGRHHFAWVPFGAGQRQCIGRDFALMEAQLVLAILMQRYIVTAPAAQTIQPAFTSTLRPKGGIIVHLAKRP
jgi:cytochrome P450